MIINFAFNGICGLNLLNIFSNGLYFGSVSYTQRIFINCLCDFISTFIICTILSIISSILSILIFLFLILYS